MKIVVIVRTRNEERNIARFCRGYTWADRILLADGGSTDRTVELARQFPNLEVRRFSDVDELGGGLHRNPDGDHLNFLCGWAESENPDWIVMDDCDCFPNYMVSQFGDRLLAEAVGDYVLLTRLYLWGSDRHFPRLSKPRDPKKWEPSLWAWAGHTGLRWTSENSHCQFLVNGSAPNFSNVLCTKVLPPYCLLHNPWPTPEIAMQKVNYYRASGLIPKMLHPLEFGGPLESLPEWAHE